MPEITLRDLFAAFALAGILASDAEYEDLPANTAYAFADDMLKARDGQLLEDDETEDETSEAAE